MAKKYLFKGVVPCTAEVAKDGTVTVQFGGDEPHTQTYTAEQFEGGAFVAAADTKEAPKKGGK